jgi:hypothetical protein
MVILWREMRRRKILVTREIFPHHFPRRIITSLHAWARDELASELRIISDDH